MFFNFLAPRFSSRGYIIFLYVEPEGRGMERNGWGGEGFFFSKYPTSMGAWCKGDEIFGPGYELNQFFRIPFFVFVAISSNLLFPLRRIPHLSSFFHFPFSDFSSLIILTPLLPSLLLFFFLILSHFSSLFLMSSRPQSFFVSHSYNLLNIIRRRYYIPHYNISPFYLINTPHNTIPHNNAHTSTQTPSTS